MLAVDGWQLAEAHPPTANCQLATANRQLSFAHDHRHRHPRRARIRKRRHAQDPRARAARAFRVAAAHEIDGPRPARLAHRHHSEDDRPFAECGGARSDHRPSGRGAAGGRVVTVEQRYESAAYATFDALLAEFMPLATGTVDGACFAVAGPVIGNTAEVTNLHWQMDAEALAAKFSISRVSLINDFYAVA